MQNAIISDLKIIPKTRPRFNPHSGIVYNPQKYVENQRDLANLFKLQLNTCLTYPITLNLKFSGNYSRCDLDNLSGAVMDALVKANILTNDTIKQIDRLIIQYLDSSNFELSVSIYPTNI
jgi:Holliday junction resolvase RusA-like endonuclease